MESSVRSARSIFFLFGDYWPDPKVGQFHQLVLADEFDFGWDFMIVNFLLGADRVDQIIEVSIFICRSRAKQQALIIL